MNDLLAWEGKVLEKVQSQIRAHLQLGKQIDQLSNFLSPHKQQNR